jgi:DHA1 family bicyclomycin/chloramphenicol resistance-like MFS transporter
MSERRVSLLGALFVALGPVALGLYTPAMPAIAMAFDTTESLAKLTLTLYFAGFAGAQLVAGPLSDALGRRPVAFAFTGLFLVASLLAALAPSIEALIAARVVQGIGASAGVAISRAIVRDLFEGQRSARIMNLIGIILALGPALAPTLGGLMLAGLGWQSIFVLMAVCGAAVIAIAATSLRETAGPGAGRPRPTVRGIAGSYLTVLGNGRFLACSTVLAGTLGTFYAQATFLPFILMERVGLSAPEFGLGLVLQSGSFFLGSLAFRRAMRRHDAFALVPAGLGIMAIGSLGLTGLLLWEPTYLRVMAPLAFFGFGIAFAMPAMTTEALAPFPHVAGAAASMMGFLQMGAGVVVSAIGGAWGDPVLALAILIPAMNLAAVAGYLAYRRMPKPPAD